VHPGWGRENGLPLITVYVVKPFSLSQQISVLISNKLYGQTEQTLYNEFDLSVTSLSLFIQVMWAVY
jgi:hypothetical protein